MTMFRTAPYTTEQQDDVNHPAHYKVGGIETIEYMKAKSTPEEFKGHLRLTALKYLSRTGYKDDALKDLKKAQWYLNRLIEECEETKTFVGYSGNRYSEFKFDKAV
jgi:hypothetical protein